MRKLLFVLGFVGIFALAVGLRPSVAQEEPPYADNEAPVYLVISFDSGFTLTPPGQSSQTIVANIGSLVGGDTVGDARFIVNTALMGLVLPDGRNDPTFDELADNAATVFGSFYTADAQGFHTAVPEPGTEDPDVQEAVFTASNAGAIDALLLQEPFPTTMQICQTIAGYLPAGSSYDEADIFDHLFGSAIQLSVTDSGALSTGEGDLYPYQPNSKHFYAFHFSFDEDGDYSQTFELHIPVAFQGPVKLSQGGELPCTIGDTDVFKAKNIVATSLKIGGVAVDNYQLKGNGELVAKWVVADLVDAGVLTKDTTELTVKGVLQEGSLTTLVTGTGPVKVK